MLDRPGARSARKYAPGRVPTPILFDASDVPAKRPSYLAVPELTRAAGITAMRQRLLVKFPARINREQYFTDRGNF